MGRDVLEIDCEWELDFWARGLTFIIEKFFGDGR